MLLHAVDGCQGQSRDLASSAAAAATERCQLIEEGAGCKDCAAVAALRHSHMHNLCFDALYKTV